MQIQLSWPPPPSSSSSGDEEAGERRRAKRSVTIVFLLPEEHLSLRDQLFSPSDTADGPEIMSGLFQNSDQEYEDLDLPPARVNLGAIEDARDSENEWL